ncbi:WD repeat-containing protein [Reticulomyxa filosa]|uniref:WD repeat-containing protein n=1 Tax=Reticulomyxa filosa TaxID=46433 RepID=X6P324_RETFI|nr:WD repeat-containing protein [Reticulomyxa filosa]|eukprot:ETO31962.1 WD repeat-containing protein [Reticulomyxa filosa]
MTILCVVKICLIFEHNGNCVSWVPSNSLMSTDINNYDWHKEFVEMKQFIISQLNLDNKYILLRNIQNKDITIDNEQHLKQICEDILLNQDSLTIFQIAIEPITNRLKNEEDEQKQSNTQYIISSSWTTTYSFDTFRASSKLLKTLIGHTSEVTSIDYSIFDDSQFICSASSDKTVRVWDIDNNQQIQLFNEHLDYVNGIKFSLYHYYIHRRNVTCFSSSDSTIRFWDIKHNQQLQILNGHTKVVHGIALSPFNSGRYLCSGSDDKTIRLWDIETSKLLHVFNGHEDIIRCVDISSLQSNNNNNNNKSNNIGVIGGNGYTICSGSADKTIQIWDIETTKALIIFKGHDDYVLSVKYGSNELGNIGCSNTTLSGSFDKSVRLWDIRSGQQIQAFIGHTDVVWAVEYLPFVVDNKEVGETSSVICSGSWDNTIQFWDIRSNKNELYVIKANMKENQGITCLKFVPLKKKENDNGVNLFYGSTNGPIHRWG